MKRITIYTKVGCPYCALAKQLLTRKGAAFDEIDISFDRSLRTEMIERSGRHTVPQVFIGDTHVGGCDDLYSLEASGRLDQLLDTEPVAA